MAGTAHPTRPRPDRRVLPWFGDPADAGPLATRTSAFDAAVLAVLVLLSCAPYVAGLGFYSDDWAFLAMMHQAGDGYARLVTALMPTGMATRPVQALEVAGLYAAFGVDPLGYHVVNSLILAATVVLFHLSLRALGFARLPALLVPLVFGLLPHYSTDRVWIAAFQANASVCLFFLALFADLRFIACDRRRRWVWKGLASLALVGSVLAYEVTAALLLFSAVLLGWQARRLGRGLASLIAIGSNVALLAAAILYKLTTTVRADIAGGYLLRVLRIVREGAPVHFGELGVALPVRVVQALRDDPSAYVLTVGVLIGACVVAWLLRVVPANADIAGTARGAALVVLGGLLFGLGYGVAFTTWEIGFHATGANNRTAIAAAIGVAFVFVGVIVAATRLLPVRARRTALIAVVACLCASASIVTGTIAEQWVRAASAQDALVDEIRTRFPDLAPGSTLLVDGLCPYVGPAPVFATSWDMTGMLQLVYDAADVRGDVLKPNSEITPGGVRTMLFDDVINVYPFEDDLFVLHARTGQIAALASEEAARTWFDTAGVDAHAACPAWTDGDGSEVF